MDVFEQLKEIIGCDYISDLKIWPYNKKAKKKVNILPLNECTLFELNDLANYIYGNVRPFENREQALIFFRVRKSDSVTYGLAGKIR
jgi:hypothetical protein